MARVLRGVQACQLERATHFLDEAIPGQQATIAEETEQCAAPDCEVCEHCCDWTEVIGYLPAKTSTPLRKMSVFDDFRWTLITDREELESMARSWKDR